jgi:lysozyme family protein
MATFEKAIGVILAHEGGYVWDTDDPGGATNFGISARWLHSEGIFNPTGGQLWSAFDIKSMPREEALVLYQTFWWDRYGFGGIRDQVVATKFFDMAVNTGAEQATVLLQRSLNELGNHVTVDGVFGPKTLAAVNLADSTRLVGKLVIHQSDFYRGLARSKPSMAKFLTGWLTRAAWPLGHGEV